ncbi:serine/threonine protein kinase [Brevibacillus sp. SYSU BS000544]|uniref:serine/threonine protein kinase n=1 Tax=Brevibacillus sp. SYSU BS000544 TaxID=3416443 RepID=UPI003CE4B780
MDIQQISAPAVIIDCLHTLNDIEIDGYSEKGGNGYVFFGYHKIMKKRVALKFYYYGDDANKEVELLAQIKHPNIIDVWDARSVGDGWAYFTTEEIRSGDLDKHIEANNIGTKKAFNIIRGLLDGVGAMHNEPNNMVHRDLKPANILLDFSGNPLIADFGSVKRIPEGQSFVSGSQHAALYRPPEVYEQGSYTYSSDIYQIGMVLYQLLGGYLPYGEQDWLNQAQQKKYNALPDDFEKSTFVDNLLHTKAKKGQLLHLDSLPAYVTQAVKRIIRTATNPDFGKRYQTTTEFLLAIHKLGEIPEWITIDEHIALINYKGKDYRVVRRGADFVCEKKLSHSACWRKESGIQEGTETGIIESILNKIT